MTASQINAERPAHLPNLGSLAAEPLDEDLVWLDLNVEPVVRQVLDPGIALKERLRLQSAACDRLDEFFARPVRRSRSASARADSLTMALHRNWQDRIQAQLAEAYGMRLLRVDELTPEQRLSLRHNVMSHAWPLLTPLAVDQRHPFPAIPDRKLNLALMLCKDRRCVVRRDKTFAIVTIPSVFGRFVELSPDVEGRKTLVLLEEAVAFNVGLLFHGFRVAACCAFRITRARGREACDARSQPPLSRRQVTRLEIADASPEVESLLRCKFGLEDWDVCRVSRPIHLGELSPLGCKSVQ